jgi:hypothetical protein
MRMLILICAVAVITGCAATSESRPRVNTMEIMQWDIVLAPDAIPSEQYAAEELQSIFEQATGRKLPIRSDAAGAGHHVFIGPGAASMAGKLGVDTSDYGPEDLRVVVDESGIVIAGGRPRGTLYGVYTFVEGSLGVRFLTPDHTHVPKVAAGSVLESMDKFYHPPLRFRWSRFGEIGNDHAFAARMRTNTVSDDPRLGGKTPIGLINHSFSRYIPWRKYGEEHPEYFCEIDGKRPSDVKDDHYNPGVQLCTTNPDVIRIITEGVLADLEKDPDRKNISVSQNDNRHYCQCEKCAADDEAAGSHMGSLLAMVNHVADAVAEKYPDVMVGTLVYQYSRKTPVGIKPRRNVQIQLCSIECCQIHPLDDPDCPLNPGFCEDLVGWGKISDNVYVWTYVTNFHNYLTPCPNFRTLGPNIRLFANNGVKGLFMQGPSAGAEFAGLRNYIISNMIWEPSRGEHELMEEFLTLHYGKAAGPIREFIELVHDTARASGKHDQCHALSSEYGLGPEIGRKGLELFDEAMRLAESDEIRRRVEKASICCHALILEPIMTPAYFKAKARRMGRDDGSAFALPVGPAEELRPLLADFIALCKKHGVERSGEWAGWDGVEAALRESYGIAPDESF